MLEKKKAINISIALILISCIISAFACQKNDFIFAMASGIFGSSFATLCIFIYEYRHQKKELLENIFQELNQICIHIPKLNYYSLSESQLIEYAKKKNYIAPVPKEAFTKFEDKDKAYYSMCRFADEMLKIGKDRFMSINKMIDDISFWSDFSFISQHKKSKFPSLDKKSKIIEKLFLPFRKTFIWQPACENGYLFDIFTDFKNYNPYSSDTVCSLICKIDNICNSYVRKDEKYWETDSPNLICYLHEQLWIFRDAFNSNEISPEQKQKAINAFFNNTPYPWIR